MRLGLEVVEKAIRPVDQPDPHHPLQQVGACQPVRHGQALFDQCLAQLILQKTRRRRSVGTL
jgi:hypothetical protein